MFQSTIPSGRTLFVAAVLSAPAWSQDTAEAEPAAPVFQDGQAQVVQAFRDPRQWIRHDLWVETEIDCDGNGKRDRVHVDVTRPKQTDTEGLKVAVIYESSPYYSGTSTSDRQFFWDPKQEVGSVPPERPNPPEIPYQAKRPLMSGSLIQQWVPRGFAVVHSAAPGTGLSQGCPTVGGDAEVLAPKAVIDWLNGRALGFTSPDGDEQVKADWCTGKVGMTGTSYNGTMCVAAASTGVEGLEAIIPVAPNTSYYHYYRSNGLVRHPGGWMGEDIDVLYNFIHSGDPKRREWCNKNVRDDLLMAKFDRQNGDWNDFWAGRDLLPRMKGLKAATLMAHAFNDWNVMPEHSVRIYEAIKAKGDVPCRAFFHQGGHGGNPPFEMMNKWFSRYLYGIENGVEGEPKSWVVRTGDRQNNPTPYPEYPHPDASGVTMYPLGGGVRVGELGNEPGAGIEGLIDDVQFRGGQLASMDHSANRLLYAGPTLTKPLHLSGTAKMKIRVAANKAAANLSVWVVSLPWEAGQRGQGRRRRVHINSNIITRGWADPQNHSSLTEGEPLKPGQFYDLEFELQPDDQLIPAGQQIGLMIFSSDQEFTVHPPAGTVLTIDLSATQLELPVVGGAAAYAEATSDR